MNRRNNKNKKRWPFLNELVRACIFSTQDSFPTTGGRETCCQALDSIFSLTVRRNTRKMVGFTICLEGHESHLALN